MAGKTVSTFNMNYIRWAFNVKQWIPTQDEWQKASMCVQKEELEKIHRFVYHQDAKASMVGRLLMRKAVSESSGFPFNKIKFSRTKKGKPILCNHEDIFGKLNYSFNVSHHGDFCVIAAQNVKNIGIDVMKVGFRGCKNLEEYFDLMKRQFSYSEWEYLTLPGLDTQKLERFYRLWCLKESFVKATGVGISQELRNISFHCATKVISQNQITFDTEVSISGNLESSWRFEETHLDENHVVAVAIELKDAGEVHHIEIMNYNPEFTLVTFEDLMRNCTPLQNLETNYWQIFACKKDKL